MDIIGVDKYMSRQSKVRLLNDKGISKGRSTSPNSVREVVKISPNPPFHLITGLIRAYAPSLVYKM
jgi:hypothetical protein